MTKPSTKYFTTRMRILAFCQIGLVLLTFWHVIYAKTYFFLIFIDAFIFIILSGYIKYLVITNKPPKDK